MIPNLRSEFKKLLSVRSTFFLAGIIVVLSCLFTYLGTSAQYTQKDQGCQPKITNTPIQGGGTKTVVIDKCPQPHISNVLPANELDSNIRSATNTGAVFAAIAVVLLMSHEYRYNTIGYTLTLSKKRSSALGSKILVSGAYVAAVTILAAAAALAFTFLAVHVKGLALPSQTLGWWSLAWQSLFDSLGFSLLGLGIAVLLRNQIAAIVSLFVLPSIDGILSALLVHYNIEPTKYLPYQALSRVAGQSTNNVSPTSAVSLGHAAIVFLAYFVLLWAVGWFLFIKRDAQ